MAFFISDPTISASIGLYARVLISGPKEDDGSDVKKDMLWYFFYHIVIVSGIKRILMWYRLQKGIWYIPELCVIYFFNINPLR